MKWNDCSAHDWEEYESQFTSEYQTQVRCIICGCPGERDEATQEVYWPAT